MGEDTYHSDYLFGAKFIDVDRDDRHIAASEDSLDYSTEKKHINVVDLDY